MCGAGCAVNPAYKFALAQTQMERWWLQCNFQANQKMAILWLIFVALFILSELAEFNKVFKKLSYVLTGKKGTFLQVLWEINPLFILRFMESRQGKRPVCLSLCLSHLL